MLEIILLLLSAGAAVPDAKIPIGEIPAPFILLNDIVLLLLPLVIKVPLAVLIKMIPFVWEIILDWSVV